MDTELLRHAGQVAGLGGIALGVLLMVFREVLRKNIFPNLAKAHAYRIIRLVVVLTFSIATIGIAGWVYVQTHSPATTRVDFPKADVRPANDEYLGFIDANRFREAWDAMAELAHERYQYDMLKQAFELQRTPLGVPVSRKLRSIGPVSRLADGTVGAFTLTEYETRFQNARVTYIEDIVAIAEAGRWKIFAHMINPCPASVCT